MSEFQFEKAINEVQKNREQVLQMFNQLKNQLNSSVEGVKAIKKAAEGTSTEDSTAELMKSPMSLVIEFFILGFYSGKMIKSLRRSI